MSETISVDQSELTTDYFVVTSLQSKQQGDEHHWIVHVRDKTTTDPYVKSPSKFRIACITDTEKIKTDATVKVTWMPGCAAERVAVAIEVVDPSEVKNRKIMNSRAGEPEYVLGVGWVESVERLGDRNDPANTNTWVLRLHQDPRSFVIEGGTKETNQLLSKHVKIKAVAIDGDDFDFDDVHSVYQVVRLKLIKETPAEDLEPRVLPTGKQHGQEEEGFVEQLNKIAENLDSAPTKDNPIKTAGKIIAVDTVQRDHEDEAWQYQLHDSAQQYLLKKLGYRQGQRPPYVRDEVLFSWSKIDTTGARIVTAYKILPQRRQEVEPPIPRYDMNESVAVIKRVRSLDQEDPAQDVWDIFVKHRDGGPKRYILPFCPDENVIKENALVRIFWVAKDDKTAQQVGFALRFDLLGQVNYLDRK